MLKNLSLGLGVGTISVAVALVALLIVTGTVFGAAHAVTVDKTTVPNPGDSGTVGVSAAANSGDGIGNWTFDIAYDTAKLETPTCALVQGGGGCQVDFGGAGTVRVAGATGDPAGLPGTVKLVDISAVTKNLAAGECTALTITVVSFDDQDGDAIASPALSNGEICIAAAATASPTASPAPSVLPPTGGTPGTSSSTNSMAWLLAATGLAVVAGGSWVLARARREN